LFLDTVEIDRVVSLGNRGRSRSFRLFLSPNEDE